MVATADYIKNSGLYKSLYISSWIFIFVIFLTVWLYFYNLSLEKKVNNLTSELSTINNYVKELNENDKVKLYTLIKTNSVFLDKYLNLSQVPLFINNVKELAKSYNITFAWFSYSNFNINTQATCNDDSINLAHQKAENFINYFRNENQDIFSLWFINNFTWQEQIKFNTSFLVK